MGNNAKNTKVCPWCGEEILETAIICRFCKNDVTPRGYEAAKAFAEGTPPPAESAPQPVKESPGPEDRREKSKAASLDEALMELSQNVPKSLLDGILESAEEVGSGEHKPITVLFSDLCGFTSLTAEIGAEAMSDLLDDIYAKAREIITRYDGIIEKFIGDAVMAVFGATQTHGDDPERAIRAVLEIRDAIQEIGKNRGLKLDSHSGIAYGEVVFTSVGGDGRADYRSIGDAVNLASRLEGQADDGEILVDHRIYKLTEEIFEWQHFDQPLKLKGCPAPITAHKVTGIKNKFARVMTEEKVELTPLIGRGREMRKLMEAAGKALDKKAPVFWLEGEAGVGKTRLSYELRRRLTGKAKGRGKPAKAEQADWQWITGRALSFGSQMPFLSMVELFKDVLAPGRETVTVEDLETFLNEVLKSRKSGGGDMRSLLRASFSLLLSLDMSGNPLLNLPPKERRERLFSALTECLRLMSKKAPLVVEMEDFQWADEDSRDLLRHFMEELQSAPVFFLLVTRPTLQKEFFKAPREMTVFTLRELSNKDSETLLRHLLGLSRLPEPLQKAVNEKTQGNPFFMEEIVLHLEETGAVVRKGDKLELAAAPGDLNVPDTVENAVLARLDRLQRQVKSVLQCASVIGQEFRRQVLGQVVEVGDRLRGYLSNLVEADYVLQQTLIPEMIYIFRHLIVRDVTYGTLLDKRRRIFHAKVAETIEELYADKLDEYVDILAHHFDLGKNFDKAIFYLEQAALKSERLYANHAAADYWERLLNTLEESRHVGKIQVKSKRHSLGDERKLDAKKQLIRLNANLHLNEICRRIGRAERAIQAGEEARQDALDMQDAKSVVKALIGMAEAYRLAGRLDEGIQALKEAQTRAGRLSDQALRASCDNYRGHFERMRGHYGEAQKAFDQVLEFANSQGNRQLRYQALNHLGIIAMYAGNTAKSRKHFQDAQELARELGRKNEWIQIEINLGLNDLRDGNPAKAEEKFGRAVNQAEIIEFERGLQLSMLALVDLHLKRGDFKKALAQCRKLLKRSDEAGFQDVRAIALGNLGRALLGLGRLKEAEESLETARSLAEADENYIALIDIQSVRAELELRRSNADAALAAAEEMLKLVTAHREYEHLAPAETLCARAQLALGDEKAAKRLAKQAVQSAAKGKVLRDQAWAAFVEGQCGLKVSKNGAGEKSLKESLKLAQKVEDADLVERVQNALATA